MHWTQSCVQQGALLEKRPAKHPCFIAQRPIRWRGHLPDSSTSSTHHLQTGGDLTVDQAAPGRTLPVRTPSRSIWR